MSDENKTPLTDAINSELTEEEKRRIEKYSKIEQSKAKRTAIVVSVTAFLILLFVGGVVGGGIYLSSYEPPENLPTEKVYYEPLPQTPADTIKALQALIPEHADKASTKVSISTSVDINDEFTVASGRDFLKNDIAFIRESIAEKIENYDTNFSTSFGDEFSDRLPVFSFEEADIKEAFCEDDEEKGKRKFTVNFAESDFEAALSNPALAVFALDEAKVVFEKFSKDISSMLTVREADIRCTSLTLYGEADSATGEAIVVGMKRAYTITADVDFVGSYAAIGSDRFVFTVEANEKYSFKHAGIDINKSVLFTEKGKSDEIIRTVTTDEDIDKVVILWTSSNPDVLSVNEKGYFKAHKISSEPVTVTANYEYLGITYTDSCLMYVRQPAESVKVNPQQLLLKPGEKATLSATLKPKDTTFTTVYWFSEDESIAVIDKDSGEITAVSEGSVKLYCLTLDGNFRDSCEVTVTN